MELHTLSPPETTQVIAKANAIVTLAGVNNSATTRRTSLGPTDDASTPPASPEAGKKTNPLQRILSGGAKQQRTNEGATEHQVKSDMSNVEVLKGGKWSCAAIVGLNQTHLVVVIPATSTLTPFDHSNGSVLPKLKGLFGRRGSAEERAEAAREYPGFIDDEPVTHILIRLEDILEDDVELIRAKNQVCVKISSFKPGSNIPTLRNGSIKFTFDAHVAGALDEAQDLVRAIEAAVLNVPRRGSTC